MTTHTDATPRMSNVNTTLTCMYGAISCLICPLRIGQVWEEVIV